jgi:stage II sporulation protein D
VNAIGSGKTLRYCFYVYKDGAVIQKGSYGTARSYSYTIPGAGQYSIKAFVKDGTGNATSKVGASVNVSSAVPLTITTVKANKASALIGDTVTWTAGVTGGSGAARCCFYVFKDGKIAERGSYGAAKMYSYTINTAGIYTVRVYGKDGSSAAIPLTGGAVTVSSEPLSITDVTVDKTVVKTGVTITWTASASGISGAPRYCFYVYKDGAVVHKGSYGPINTFSYSPTVSGSYTVKAFVKDSVGNAVSKTCGTSVNVQDV